MHKLWAVVRREFGARVHTKSFVITTVLGPLLMAALMVAPALMSMKESSGRHIVIVDGGDRALTAHPNRGGPYPFLFVDSIIPLS